MRNENMIEPQNQQSCQASVSDSSLDKLISKLPIVYDWVNYKGEDVVASINIERTLKAKKAMMDISYCMTKAFNDIHLKTVMFNKKHFKKSKLSDSDIDW